MKKIAFIILALVWVSSLIILIIALTDIYPNTIFSEYRSSVGIAFIIITGLLKLMYNAVNKKSNTRVSSHQN